MSYGTGGRADKAGNSYENGILAEQLIELICEHVFSIEIEPLGDEGHGVEFVVTRNNGDKEILSVQSSECQQRILASL